MPQPPSNRIFFDQWNNMSYHDIKKKREREVGAGVNLTMGKSPMPGCKDTGQCIRYRSR